MRLEGSRARRLWFITRNAAESPKGWAFIASAYLGSAVRLFNSSVSTRLLRGTLALLLALLTPLLGVAMALAQDMPAVLATRVSTTPERARLIVDLSGVTEFAVASMTEPDRIAVDLRADSVPTVATQNVAGQGIVASFTSVVATEGRVRVELLLATPAMGQEAVRIAFI